jgi:hypothetical protein
MCQIIPLLSNRWQGGCIWRREHKESKTRKACKALQWHRWLGAVSQASISGHKTIHCWSNQGNVRCMLNVNCITRWLEWTKSKMYSDVYEPMSSYFILDWAQCQQPSWQLEWRLGRADGCTQLGLSTLTDYWNRSNMLQQFFKAFCSFPKHSTVFQRCSIILVYFNLALAPSQHHPNRQPCLCLLPKCTTRASTFMRLRVMHPGKVLKI